MTGAILALMQLGAPEQQQLRAAITDALAAAHSDMKPNVQFVGNDHWAFLNKRKLAMAARDEDGKSWILFNRDASAADLIPRAQHEVAHLLTWERFGEGVPEHGSEFRNICRQTVTVRPSHFCKGYH